MNFEINCTEWIKLALSQKFTWRNLQRNRKKPICVFLNSHSFLFIYKFLNLMNLNYNLLADVFFYLINDFWRSVTSVSCFKNKGRHFEWLYSCNNCSQIIGFPSCRTVVKIQRPYVSYIIIQQSLSAYVRRN